MIENADKIIWLDYSFPLVFWRITKRTLKRVFLKQSCCNGNFETFHQQFFSKDSMFYWVVKKFHARRKEHQRLLVDTDLAPKMLHLHSPADVKSTLKQLTL